MQQTNTRVRVYCSLMGNAVQVHNSSADHGSDCPFGPNSHTHAPDFRTLASGVCVLDIGTGTCICKSIYRVFGVFKLEVSCVPRYPKQELESRSNQAAGSSYMY